MNGVCLTSVAQDERFERGTQGTNVHERSDMKQTKHTKVPMCSAEDFFSGKKDTKPVG